MALSKQQLLDLIEKNCTEQGDFSVPGPILKELVENYIPSISTEEAIADLDQVTDVIVVKRTVTVTAWDENAIVIMQP